MFAGLAIQSASAGAWLFVVTVLRRAEFAGETGHARERSGLNQLAGLFDLTAAQQVNGPGGNGQDRVHQLVVRRVLPIAPIDVGEDRL